jgi:hypothetical protein
MEEITGGIVPGTHIPRRELSGEVSWGWVSNNESTDSSYFPYGSLRIRLWNVRIP